mgnify:FL=1
MVPGLRANEIGACVTMSASILVDLRSGRLTGTTVEADGEAQGDAGFACEGGAVSLSKSSEDVLKETVTRLAITGGSGPESKCS